MQKKAPKPKEIRAHIKELLLQQTLQEATRTKLEGSPCYPEQQQR